MIGVAYLALKRQALFPCPFGASLGMTLLWLDNISSLPCTALGLFGLLGVVLDHPLRLCGKSLTAFFERQSHVRTALRQGKPLICFCHVSLHLSQSSAEVESPC